MEMFGYSFGSNAFHFTETYAIQLTFILTKTQYQSAALYYLFVRQFSDMFHSDLTGHLWGDFYNVGNICFNLTIRIFTCD
jgi:hypothetical protein